MAYGVSGIVLFKLFGFRKGFVGILGNILQLAAVGGSFLMARQWYCARTVKAASLRDIENRQEH